MDGWIWCFAEANVASPLLGTNRLTAFLEIESPQLWWPNGLGQPILHDLFLTLEIEGCLTERFMQKVGLREVGRVPARGQRPIDIPLQFAINQVPFFINGVNWVPPDSCVGDISPGQYDRQLEAFQAGHVNLVRVWGGGLREKSHFYERLRRVGAAGFFKSIQSRAAWGSRNPIIVSCSPRRGRSCEPCGVIPASFSSVGGNENYHYWHMLDSDDPQHCRRQ